MLAALINMMDILRYANFFKGLTVSQYLFCLLHCGYRFYTGQSININTAYSFCKYLMCKMVTMRRKNLYPILILSFQLRRP
jgi:hypothetical protein